MVTLTLENPRRGQRKEFKNLREYHVTEDGQIHVTHNPEWRDNHDNQVERFGLDWRVMSITGLRGENN